jgi:hypothetical protein
MDSIEILAVLVREICWSRRAFGAFKLNHTRTKFVNHIKEFRFYPQWHVFQLKWQMT